jgi:hypothetical protein
MGHPPGMTARVPLPVTLRNAPFSYREGLAAGLGAGRLRGADLQKPFAGTRSAQTDALLLTDRCLALQTRLPEHTFFCGLTAAALLGIPLPPWCASQLALHVGAPAPARAPHARGIVGHRYRLDAASVRPWRGLRLTTAERTWCDIASALTLHDLVAAGDYIVHWRRPLAHPSSLALEHRLHPGRRGAPNRRAALGLIDGRSESPAESVLRVTLELAGIRGLIPNAVVTADDGRFLGRVDLALPDLRVAIEYEGDYHRTEAGRWRKDMTRVSRLEAAGWYVVRVNADDLKHPEELVSRVLTVLARRGARFGA